MQKFELTLKNEKVKLYNLLSWLIIAINIIVFTYFAFFSTDKGVRGSAIAILIFLAILFGLQFYFRNTKYQFGFHIFFISLLGAWLAKGFYGMAAIHVVFDILYSFSTAKKVAIFSSDYFHYPSFPQKTIYWNQVTNALLKDGLLTIDLKNNKLIQQLIDENETVIDEKEFNDFCKAQLKAAASQPNDSITQ